jgi:DNA-binding NarL/FixJ family response regulator
MKPVRVVLADDDNLVRVGFKALFETIKGIEVVGEAADGQSAVLKCQQLKPDVLFLDVNMPNLNGIEVASRVGRDCPNTRVIMLSMLTDSKYINRALEAGVAGYLPKSTDVPELSIALEKVLQRETYISPLIAGQVTMHLDSAGDSVEDTLALLTNRQREVLQLIAEGHSTKEIAQILSISIKTAETHRGHVMKRLDTYDVAGLVKVAIRTGLVILNE